MSTKTYERVVDLLNAEIPAKISRNEFSRVTGINRNSIDRYKAGLGTPIFETLEKLQDYFGVSVAWLRGHYPQMSYEEAKQFDKHMKAQRAANLEGGGAPDVPIYTGWCARCGGPVVLRKKSLAVLGYDVDPCPTCCKQSSSE